MPQKKRILVVRSRLLVAPAKRTTNNFERCWGLISGSLYPGAYIRELITGGLISGAYIPGGLQSVAYIWGHISRGLIYLRRQQERGLAQKARCLMDENSVSFQMFLIVLSSVTLGSESQIPVFKEGQSNT